MKTADSLELWQAARPAGEQPKVDHVPYSFGRKPIAQHNAEMEAHMAKYFPADPGRKAFVFLWDAARNAYLTQIPVPAEWTPRAGFLNYDGKLETLAVEGGHACLKRRDLTAAEFHALPLVPATATVPNHS